jgi:hypothetical protein
MKQIVVKKLQQIHNKKEKPDWIKNFKFTVNGKVCPNNLFLMNIYN